MRPEEAYIGYKLQQTKHTLLLINIHHISIELFAAIT